MIHLVELDQITIPADRFTVFTAVVRIALLCITTVTVFSAYNPVDFIKRSTKFFTSKLNHLKREAPDSSLVLLVLSGLVSNYLNPHVNSITKFIFARCIRIDFVKYSARLIRSLHSTFGSQFATVIFPTLIFVFLLLLSFLCFSLITVG